MEERGYSVSRNGSEETTGSSLNFYENDALRSVGDDPAPREIPDLARIDPTCRMERASRGLHDTASHLCVLPSSLRKRILARRLLGFWSEKDKCWKLPEIQFDKGWPLSGLEQVLQSMPDHLTPVEVYGFLTTPHLDLEDAKGNALTPAEWLRQGGDRAAVIGLLEV